MSYKVLIPQDISKAGKKYLEDKGYEIIIGTDSSEETIKREVIDCDAILARTAPYTRGIMKAGNKLKVISRYGAGVDNIDIDAATELGIQVTNAPLANCNSVAEHTIALILACASNIVFMDKQTRIGNWEKRNEVKRIDIKSKTLGLIGLGRIGRLVAEKAYYGFGMRVIAYDPYISKDSIVEYIELKENRDDVFKDSDFISLHIPSTPETKRSINKDVFKLMKKTAYLINCARGEVVHEEDLYKALLNEDIRGAALDVFENEPPGNNPLFSLDNLIVSPHYAALSYEAMDTMGIHAAMGIDEVLNNKKPTWPVNNLNI